MWFLDWFQIYNYFISSFIYKNLCTLSYETVKRTLFDDIHKNIFTCLFSIHNSISLSCHEQVNLSGLRPDDGRSISRNVAHLNLLVHDVINLLYSI